MHRLLSAVAVLLAATTARAEDLTSCEQGSNAHKAGNYDQAIADYDAAINLKPGYPLALSNRGAAYSSMGQPDRAIADYDAAIRLDPGDAGTFVNRGGAYGDKGLEWTLKVRHG